MFVLSLSCSIIYLLIYLFLFPSTPDIPSVISHQPRSATRGPGEWQGHRGRGAKTRVRVLYREQSPNPSARWPLSARAMDNPHDSHIEVMHKHTHAHSRSRGSNICSEVENLLLAAATSASPPFKHFWHGPAALTEARTSFVIHPIVGKQRLRQGSGAATGQETEKRSRRCVPTSRSSSSPPPPLGASALCKDARSTHRWTDLLGERLLLLDLLRCVHAGAILTAAQLFKTMSVCVISCCHRLSD